MKNLIIATLFLFGLNLSAQILDPIDWSHEVNKISDDEYELIINADFEPGWHIYSQFITFGEDEIGPIATEVIFLDTDDNYELVGKTTEPETEPVFDKAFGMEISYFGGAAQFKQRIKVLNPDLDQVKGEVSYQVCDDTRCLAPETEEFTFSLNPINKAKAEAGAVTLEDVKKSNALNLNVKGWDNYKQDRFSKKSNFSVFLLGFLGGLIALLTPCVFPMIPLTVSFFTKSATNTQKGMANSIMYGFFIFLIYVLLSIPFHLIDSLDPEILNNISTNVTLNIIFFLVFLFFAFSFFGYYELTLPSSWGTKLDHKATKIGGLVGVFLMALTLAIVSFSCTGPILGALLGSTALSTGDVATKLTMGMAGFGLALALPFTLFAMFPKWLNTLPKSGGWLNTIKVVLGFIELALAFKFLSNADLVEHWGLLKREVFIGIWVLIALLTAIYLFGKMKFPHDSPLQKLSFSRISLGVLFIAITIYLIPGLSNTKHANLKLLSGIAPPIFYSVYEKDNNCPLGIECYKDLAEGLAVAKAENRPIMLDFTGWACVNCRKMEEHVWSKSSVFDRLNDDYVLISLYVDDRRELKALEKFKFLKPNGSIKNINTIGDKWATLQTLNFNNNSQPYYVLINNNMELLNHPIAYTPDADEYSEWLKVGIENFEKSFPNK